jgi:hypothetical protein
MPTCSVSHERALGDEQTEFLVHLKRNGVAVDVTGKDVEFYLYDQDGNTVIDAGAMTKVDASLGYVSYDFQAADYAAMSADTESPLALQGEETFYGFIKVLDGTETDTFPADLSAIQVRIFNPAASRTTASPDITIDDIMALAKSPRRVRTVEGTVEERSVREMILADQYQSAKAASGDIPWGMRIAVTKPGSTVSN